MQKCNYKLTIDGVEHSFNNEWELDSFMYSRSKKFLGDSTKSSIVFSTENPAEITRVAVEALEKMAQDAAISFEKHTVSVDGEAEETEIVFKIPNSLGVSKFIDSVGKTTTAFDKNQLFANWGISDKLITSTIEKDWEKVRNSGDFIHEIFDYVNNNRGESIDAVREKFKSKLPLVSAEALNTIIRQLKDLQQKLAQTYEYVYTEIPVMSKEFKDESLNKIGKNSINGRLDILCIDKNGAVHIFDLKTSPKSVGDWGVTSNAAIDINEYSSAKKRNIARQLVAYRAMLKQHGLNVASLNIIPIKLNFEYSKSTPINREGKVVIKQYDATSLNGISIENIVSNLGDSAIVEAERDFRKYFSNAEELDIDVYKDVVIPTTTKLFKEFNKRNERRGYTVEEFFKNRNNVRIITDKPGYKYYFYNRFELEGKKHVYCKDAEECKEKIAKYLTQWEESKAELSSTIAQSIINVLSGSIEVSSFLDSSPMSASQREYYTQLFAPYLEYGDITWNLVNNESLVRMGIFMFKSSTGLVDIIQISDQPLHDVLQLKYGDSILGSYSRNYDADVRQDKLVKATYGNIEIMSTLLLLNSNKELLGDCKIHNIRVCHPEIHKISELPTSVMLYNFKQLCEVANLRDTEFGKINLSLTASDFISVWDYVLNTLSGKTFGKQIISKYKGDVNDKLAAIEWVKSSMTLLKTYNKKVAASLNSGEWDLEHDESKAFILLSQALGSLTGNELTLEKDAPAYIGLEKGFSIGINLTTPHFAPSQAMQSLGMIVQRAHTKVTSELSKIINKEMGKYIDALYKSKGRMLVVGGEYRYYSNLFVTENGKIHPDFLLKSVNDPSLNKEEREFLQNFFKVLDRFRYKNDLLKEEALIDGSYYQVPLLKAAFVEQIHHSGVKTTLEHKWDDQLDDLNLFQEQRGEQTEALNKYTPYNPYDISQENRAALLLDHGVGEFETNLETILISYVKSKLRQNEYERIMPEVLGIKTMLAYYHNLHGQDVKVSQKAIDDFIKLNLFDKPIMDGNLHTVYRALNSVKSMATYLTLGGNYRSGMRETLQGMWTHISRTMVEMYGKDQFNLKDIAKAWTIVFKLGLKNPNFITMFEQLNADYQMTNAGIIEIDTLISRAQAGLLNFSSDDLFIFNKIPDYFHRMGILIAKMLHDGSWDAHSMQNGVMVYDFNKDKRYNLLNKAGVDKNSKEYKEQLSTYLTMREQFISEGFTIAEVKEGQPIQELPRAYTLQESGSIKLFADLCFGHYDKETQMLLKHTFLGAFIMQFKTFYSAKLEQWILNPGSYKAMGSYKEQFDTEGVRYMRRIKIAEDSTVTSEIVKESELSADDYAIPFKDWEGKYMEGIAFTLFDAGKSLIKGDWTELQHQMQNETKKANFVLFIHDMIWSQIMMWVIAALFLNNEDVDRSVFEESVINAWHQSYSDGPITNLLSAQITDINPPMYRTIKKLYNTTTDLITGQKNVLDWMYSNIGALRDVATVVKSRE